MSDHSTAQTHGAPADCGRFADQVRAIPGGEHLEVCYSCGTCVSKCMIQQKVEPEYNPRRLLRLVMMDMRKEAFESPTTWLCSACDLCYPACPQEIHISGVIGAVKQLAVEAGYESPLETVSVDEDAVLRLRHLRVGLSLRSAAPGRDRGQVNGNGHRTMDRVSEVDANKCMGCGTCVAACPLGAISRPGVGNEEVIEQMAPDVSAEQPGRDGAPTPARLCVRLVPARRRRCRAAGELSRQRARGPHPVLGPHRPPDGAVGAALGHRRRAGLRLRAGRVPLQAGHIRSAPARSACWAVCSTR